MHERRKVEIEAVKERRVRRQRLLVEANAAADAEETAGRLNTVVEQLQRESAEEARIAARLKQLAAEEAVLVSNRNQRMAQYTERREKDWAEAIAREVELSEALKVRSTPPLAVVGRRAGCSKARHKSAACYWHVAGTGLHGSCWWCVGTSIGRGGAGEARVAACTSHA